MKFYKNQLFNIIYLNGAVRNYEKTRLSFTDCEIWYIIKSSDFFAKKSGKYIL